MKEQIDSRRHQWYRYVKRTGDERLPKEALEWIEERKRPGGRHRTMWKNQLKAIGEKRGMTGGKCGEGKSR